MKNRIYLIASILILGVFQSCKKDTDEIEKEEKVSDTTKVEAQVKNNQALFTKGLVSKSVVDSNNIFVEKVDSIAKVEVVENKWGTLVDADGNKYKTVKIGKQIWMAENLRVTSFRNGDKIDNAPSVPVYLKYANRDLSTLPSYWCNYTSDAKLDNSYGKLYNLAAVYSHSNIAPEGWHVATEKDWKELLEFVGSPEKLMAVTGWINKDKDTGGSNDTGFSALPGGGRVFSGYENLYRVGKWWATEPRSVVLHTKSNVRGDEGLVFCIDGSREGEFQWKSRACFYSVRCVKN
ncbi:MAG TPA: fibrobacter succinogenes major paralogous domain-containing protein [Flavobacterium sp.]